MITAFNVRNATLVYGDGRKLFLRLITKGVHGDFKDMHRKFVPIGTYEVKEVWDNFYGKWIRIQHEDKLYDISPQSFEYHKEDQIEIKDLT